MGFIFKDLDALLLEPLIYEEKDKNFLKKIQKLYPEDIIILDEKDEKKIAYRWIKLKISENGLLVFFKIYNHFGDYLKIYILNHILFSDFPKEFININEKIEIDKKIDNKEIIQKIGDILDGE